MFNHLIQNPRSHSALVLLTLLLSFAILLLPLAFYFVNQGYI